MRTIVLITALGAALTAPGYAGTSYSTGLTTDAGNNAVDATANLSLSMVSGTEVLTIVLDNLSPNQVSDGENVTGIQLNINTSQITGVTLASATADLIQVPNKTSTPTDLGPGSLSHWAASTSLSDVTLTTIGTGTPTGGIIGAPNSSGIYSNAGGSLTANTKWPFANQTATFMLDLTGTNISLSSITVAEIGFGTLGTNYIMAYPAPEPRTFWLLGASAVLIGLGSQRKRFGKS